MDSTNTTSATVLTKLKTLLELPEDVLHRIPVEMLLKIEDSLKDAVRQAERDKYDDELCDKEEEEGLECDECNVIYKDENVQQYGMRLLCRRCSKALKVGWEDEDDEDCDYAVELQLEDEKKWYGGNHFG